MTLQGSEKQVAWAADIQEQFKEKLRKYYALQVTHGRLTEEQLEQGIQNILNTLGEINNHASTWIDNRNSSALDIINAVNDILKSKKQKA